MVIDTFFRLLGHSKLFHPFGKLREDTIFIVPFAIQILFCFILS